MEFSRDQPKVAHEDLMLMMLRGSVYVLGCIGPVNSRAGALESVFVKDGGRVTFGL